MSEKSKKTRAIIEDEFLLCPKCNQKLIYTTSLRNIAIRGIDKNDSLVCPECRDEFHPIYEGDYLVDAELIKT